MLLRLDIRVHGTQAKKSSELSSFNTNPRPGPAFTQQTLTFMRDRESLLRCQHGCCSWKRIFLRSCKAPDHLMSSSHFICARSSTPAISVRSDVDLWGSDIPIPLLYVRVYEYVPVYSAFTEQDACCRLRDIRKTIPPHHK